MPRDKPLPLSFAQQRVWFLSQLAADAQPYNEQGALGLDGPLDVAALRRAFETIVQRHEVLRTAFLLEDGRVGQRIQPEGGVAFELVELPPGTAAQQQEAVEAAAMGDVERPFDLAHGPLLRVRLLRLAPERHVLVLTAHHIVADAWATGVLLRELAELYTAYREGRPPALPSLPVQYGDFAVWQRRLLEGERLQRQLAWWREQLAGAPPALELPGARPRPAAQSFVGDRVRFTLDPALSAAARALCRETGCTLFAALLAAFAALLWRYGAGRDLVIGSPVAYRRRPELEPLIGFFANTLALRIRIEGDPSFRDLLAQVQGVITDALDHQDVPFERLVDDLAPARDRSRNPVFQVLCALQRTPVERVALPDLELRPVATPKRTSKFDLSLVLWESEVAIAAEFEYCAALFDAPQVERLRDHYLRLLASALVAPDAPVARAALLAPAEARQVTVEWNQTGRVYAGGFVHALIAEQAARTPAAPAVEFEGGAWTYAELERRANHLAHLLRRRGVGPEARVAVCMERSPALVLALLAVMKAGGAWVPIEPTYPAERRRWLLADAAPALVLAHGPTAGLVADAGVVVLDLDADWALAAAEPPEPPAVRVADASAAYVIYTSGSTGRPKGAINTHGGLRNRLLWMQETFRLDATDAVLQKTPFSFDVSVWEFFWPLMTGARLVVARPDGHRDAAYLARLIQERAVTTVHFVPSLLRAFLEEPLAGACTSLRRVLCSGEALTAEVRDRCFARLGAELHNLYGPTEASIDVTHWACARDDRAPVVPIGRPIANTRIFILDEEGQPTPIGVPGELYIEGGLARGYLGRPGLTAERFVPHPFSATPGARLYRTGDRARWRSDGALEFLGRLDFQVKVRGFRIEPGEVEDALARQVGVREAVVLPRAGAGGTRLVAYVVPANEQVRADALRAALAAELPDYLVPSAFVLLDALPRLTSGKVDRAALPEPEAPSAAAPGYAAPSTPVEEALAAIWADVLGLERVGVDDSFFALGGDSILSIQVAARARAAGLDVAVADLFEHQTVRALARALDRPAPPAGPRPSCPFVHRAGEAHSPEDWGVRAVDAEDAWPLATLQEGMLFHAELAPVSGVYHDVFSFDVQAPFDVTRFRAAVGAVLRAHPVLRSAFALTGYARPLQIVYRDCPLPLAVADVSALPEAAQQAAIAAWARAEQARGFDWRRPPLWRLQVHRRAPDRFRLSLSFHHAILDGWSVATLLTELLRAYRAVLAGQAATVAPPASSYRDFVVTEQAALASEAARTFWTDALAGVGRALLPRWPRRYRTVAGLGRLDVPLGADLSAALQRAARAAGVPLKSVLLAAHARVLATLTGQPEAVTGVVSSGRLEEPDGERVLGLFLNVLPLRVGLPGGTWTDLARAAFRAECAALPFRRYPFAALQRDLGGGPLVETLFNFVHFHVYRDGAQPEDLAVAGAYVFERTNFPLVTTFSLDPFSAAVSLTLTYDGAELAPEQVAAIGERYTAALAALAAAPEGRHDAADLLSAAERQRVLYAWNATARPRSERLLYERFLEQARQQPAAPALVCAGRTLTYAELEGRSARLAARLAAAGLRPGQLAAVCLPRTEALLVALLAVLRCGAGYVPLDPAYPPERLRYMVADARPSLVLTDAQLAALWRQDTPPLVIVDAPSPEGAAPLAQAPVPPESVAYVLYTSGSTGPPKGVAVTHRSAAALVEWAAEAFSPAELARVVASTSVCFDLSVFELFVPLSYGGTVVLVEDALALAALPPEAAPTLVNTVPSAMAEVLAAGGLPPSVRTVALAGEPLPPALAAALYALPTVQRVVNLYGPTEDTTYSTWADVPREGTDLPPIGRPIANTRAYVLDDALRPVGVGVPGELYLAGAGLAQGYVRRPAQTAERFLPDPFAPERGARMYRTGDLVAWQPDGQLQFLGRRDRQVKLRGFRIEPGEIEWALGREPRVAQAAVRAWAGPGGPRLVAYVVPQPAARDEPGLALALEGALRGRLPAHMVPAAFVLLDELPRTPNGKIDYGALPEPAWGQGAAPATREPPQTPLEQAVAALWRDVLDVDAIGRDAHFFQLGGHSLLAMRLIVRARAAFGVDLPLATLFEAPTVATFAARVALAQTASSAPAAGLPEGLVRLGGEGDGPPLVLIPPAAGSPLCYQHLVRALRLSRPVYGLVAPGLLDDATPPTTVEGFAAAYAVALRRVQPHGPYWLAGWSFGGLVALELARQLEAAGEPIAFLGLLDSGLYDGAEPRVGARGVAALVRVLGAIVTKAPLPRSYREARFLAASLGVSLPEAPGALLRRGPRAQARWLAALTSSLSRSVRVVRASFRASARYRGGPYGGPATLFRATAARPADVARLIAGLRRLCIAGLTVQATAGNHMSMVLDERAAATLAAGLRAVLEAAADRQPMPAAPRGREL